jgi:hypothetical protein
MWTNDPRANIGLAIQPGFLAIDADLYKPGKEAALALYEKNHGELPETLEFRSARGGVHLIYATDRNLGNSVGTLPAFGDVRGSGGLIIGPGSFFEGLRYTVDNLATIADLPADVSNRLREPKHRAPEERRELPQFVNLDDPTNIERFVTWLQREARPSIEGQGGNNMLAATGAAGSSYALSWEMTLECLQEHFNPRCEPPWDDADLEKHGGSGYRSASSSFGNMATRDPHLMFAPVRGSPSIFQTMADIVRAAPPREWATGTDADGWVPLGGVTLVLGPEGTGKSLLAQQWSQAQARGDDLFGIPCRQMPVLLINCEDSAAELHRRYDKLGKRPDDPITFASMVNKDTMLLPAFRYGVIPDDAADTPFYTLLDEQLGKMPSGPKMLFLDNTAHLYPGDYTKPGEIMHFLKVCLGGLADRHDATIVLFMHPSSAGRASGDGSYGGVGWSGTVRARLYFEFHMSTPGRGPKGGIIRGETKRIGEERVFSRKKANYAKSGDDTRLIVNLVAGSRFERKEKTSSEPQSVFVPVTGRPHAAELHIVREAVNEVLCRNRSISHSGVGLAQAVSHYLGTQGSTVAENTIRNGYLGLLRQEGHPGFGNGRWAYVPAIDNGKSLQTGG